MEVAEGKLLTSGIPLAEKQVQGSEKVRFASVVRTR